jgi:hypothetical protein
MNLPNKPKVLASTYNPVSDTRMISFLVDFPTVLLAELRTHRILTQGSLYEHSELVDFNLSANSARAIPAKTYLNKILENPFKPIWTGKQAGMSGSVVTEQQKEEATYLWLEHLQSDIVDTGTAQYVEDLIELGIHKQNANRLLAPFAYTTCILSGTEWENFFLLRCPQYLCLDGNSYKSKKEWWYFAKLYYGFGSENIQEPNWEEINKSSAQPEFQVIVEMLYDLYQEAIWSESQYHIPFEEDIDKLIQDWIINGGDMSTIYNRDTDDLDAEYNQLMMQISASLCAKLSYNTQDKEDTLEKHLERAKMLIEHKHSEPFSHQAVAMNEQEYELFAKMMIVSESKLKASHVNPHKFKYLKGDLLSVREEGWCYNNRGFITKRYILENYN